jgi:hypothetical protein
MHLKYFASFLLILACFTGSGQTPTTVYTCKSGAVAAATYAEFSQAQINAANAQTQSNYGYLGITIIGDASAQYNCHAYAWHLREGNSNRVWINNATSPVGSCYPQTHNIDKYWTDGCFIQVCNEANADKAHYYCGDHSAVASTSNPGLWESKWGQLSVVRHSRTGVPYSDPVNSVNFYASTKITGSTSYMCSGSRVYSVKSIPGATYTWTYSSTLTITGATNTNQLTVQRNGTQRGGAWVQVVITTPCSAISATSRLDFWVGGPQISIAYSPSGSCNGTWQTWSLSASASYGSNWHWYADVNPGNFNIYSPYSSSTFVSVTGGGGVRLTYTDLCGASQLDGVTIWSNCHGFRVGPNPATSTISISAEPGASGTSRSTATFSEVNLYDKDGNLKKHFVFKGARSATLDVNDLPLGIYIIEIVEGSLKERQKLEIIK